MQRRYFYLNKYYLKNQLEKDWNSLYANDREDYLRKNMFEEIHKIYVKLCNNFPVEPVYKIVTSNAFKKFDRNGSMIKFVNYHLSSLQYKKKDNREWFELLPPHFFRGLMEWRVVDTFKYESDWDFDGYLQEEHGILTNLENKSNHWQIESDLFCMPRGIKSLWGCDNIKVIFDNYEDDQRFANHTYHFENDLFHIFRIVLINNKKFQNEPENINKHLHLCDIREIEFTQRGKSRKDELLVYKSKMQKLFTDADIKINALNLSTQMANLECQLMIYLISLTRTADQGDKIFQGFCPYNICLHLLAHFV